MEKDYIIKSNLQEVSINILHQILCCTCICDSAETDDD